MDIVSLFYCSLAAYELNSKPDINLNAFSLVLVTKNTRYMKIKGNYDFETLGILPKLQGLNCFKIRSET